MKQLLHIRFIWGEQGLSMNPGEYKGVFRVNVNHCWEFKVLGMPHLHGEVFQKSLVVVLSWALGGWVLIQKKEVDLVGLPRSAQPSLVRGCGDWAPRIRSKKGKPCQKRESSILC